MSEYYVQCECGRKLDAKVDDMLNARVRELEADLATWRQIGTANAARIEGLAAALRNLLEALDLRRDWQPLQPAIDAAKAALSGARTAAGVEPNTYTHPYSRKCNRCGKELRFKEPCLATVVYCDLICAD